MLRGVEQLGCLLLCGLGAWAQEAPKIVVNVEGFRYPQIARSARIQGDVIFEVSALGQRLVTGHSLLAKAAQVNLETWTLPPFEGGNYLVWYHFRLDEPGAKTETELIGSRFERLFLRLFHSPTRRVAEVCDDDYNFPTETHVRQIPNQENGDYVIHVSLTSRARCLETEASTIAAAYP
jgi:hypothetical protein